MDGRKARRATMTMAAVAAVGIASVATARQAAAPAAQPARQAPERAGEPGKPGAPEGAARVPVSVESAMKSIERAYKALKPQIADPSKQEENVRLVAEMLRGAAIAKAQPVPADVLERAANDAERAKFAAEYRRSLSAAMRLLLDIEDDVLAGRGEDARSKLEAVHDLEHEAHETLGVEEH